MASYVTYSITILTKNFPRVAQGGKVPKEVRKCAESSEMWEAGKIGSFFSQVGSNSVHGNLGNIWKKTHACSYTVDIIGSRRLSRFRWHQGQQNRDM